MLAIATIHSSAVSAYRFLDKYPVLEVATLLVLAIITVYRKKLSSNDEYRRKAPSTPKANKRKSIAVVCALKHGSASFPEISSDVMVNIMSYLTNYEIGCVMGTSKKMYKEISADGIWEQLWLQTYGSMWQHPEIRKIREGRGLFWDPMLNYGPPQQGWYRFFLLFEVSYMDWLLAGYCTHSRCLAGINHSIVDVTDFIDVHPGSSETLTEGAGCDATETFAEIGHSTRAEQLMGTLKIWDSSSNNEPVCLCSDVHLQRGKCGHCLHVSRSRGKSARRHTVAEYCHQIRRFPAKTRLHEHMKVNQKKVMELALSKHKQACSDAVTAENGLEGFASVIPMIEAAVNDAVPPLSLLRGSVDSYDDDSDPGDTDSLSSESSVASSSTGSSGVYSDDVGEGVIEHDGIPDVPQNLTLFSPAKALTSILDKIKREYRKGSLQLRGVSGSSFRGSRSFEDRDADGSGPPIASYFGPSHRLVPHLEGYFPCVGPQDHMGQPKAFFDPFTAEWTAWWSCCGQGQVLVEAPHPEPDPIRDAVFCK
jgi:cytochrome b involved in lipid metabolism